MTPGLEQVRLTPLNARALLEQALLLDGREPGEHVEALRAQFRRQVMAGYAERAEERDIRNRRPRGPAQTPRTRVRGPSRIAPLTELSAAKVLHIFDTVRFALAKAPEHSKRRRRHQRNLEALTNELRRRSLWVEVER